MTDVAEGYGPFPGYPHFLGLRIKEETILLTKEETNLFEIFWLCIVYKQLLTLIFLYDFLKIKFCVPQVFYELLLIKVLFIFSFS